MKINISYKLSLFEPAGELEVDYSSSEESEEDISVLELPSKNVKKLHQHRKKVYTIFVKDISLVEIEK